MSGGMSDCAKLWKDKIGEEREEKRRIKAMKLLEAVEHLMKVIKEG